MKRPPQASSYAHAAQTTVEDSDAVLNVAVSHILRADLERRGVFPEIRLTEPHYRFTAAAMCFHLSPSIANALLVDARQMRRTAPTGGLKCSYRAMAKHLEEVFLDRGRETAKQNAAYQKAEAAARLADSPARFLPGDEARVAYPDGLSAGTVTVVWGYGLHRVARGEHGDEPADYRYGYLATAGSSLPMFFAPHRLVAVDGSVRHLRLLSDAWPADTAASLGAKAGL